MEQNLSYLTRRAEQERSAAEHAADAKARAAHLELARRYRERLGDTVQRTGPEARAGAAAGA
jgi:hypothetical protein